MIKPTFFKLKKSIQVKFSKFVRFLYFLTDLNSRGII